MARRVFFSLHYQRDVWRVNQIRNAPNIIGSAAAGFHDAGVWEEARRKGDGAIKALIEEGLKGTSVTVVCIGLYTAQRKYVNHEITRSLAIGNGLVGLRIHHLRDQNKNQDPPGEIPALLVANGVPTYSYTDAASLGRLIEEAAQRAGR